MPGNKSGASLESELTQFFGEDVGNLPIVSRSYSMVDLPNLERAITGYAEKTSASYRAIGYISEQSFFYNELRALFSTKATVTAPDYREVDIDVNSQMRCVENGIHLIKDSVGLIAAHVRSDRMTHGLEMEVLTTSPELASDFLEKVRVAIAEANVYRGKALSLECDARMPGRSGFSALRFHRFPRVEREEIILPAATLEMLERNTVRYFQNVALLRQSGRALKRGLLLHGKPGTGKTYTAKWLAQALPNVTTILISADQLGLIKECCQLARLLAPALVILEDVDLIAGERDEKRHPAYQITLHQLMNEMDGLSSNLEVLFLLTTNRPEVIESAIAARPGRIDQAIEFPLPDAECRQRLLSFYSKGLTLSLKEPGQVVERTAGASPAFIQELIRKAAMIAAEQGDVTDGVIQVSDSHMDIALREMVYGGGALTRSLLGFSSQESETVNIERESV
ncbi:MAG: ATP-binding protein [Armatimonas sp.]